ASGDGVKLDPGEVRNVAELLRHQRGKQSGADTGLEHTAAAPAQALQSGPDRPNDILGGEMRILGAARQRGVVAGIDDGFQLVADVVPAGAELPLTRTTEDAVGQLGCPEPGKPDELRLFRDSRWTLLVYDP